jgi:GNAT superfamily N-acetyltransferase
MDELSLRRAEEGDLPALARLIAGQNRDPATQCIHSETGGSERAVLEEMATLNGAGELIFVLGAVGDRLVGAMGSEVDEEAGRGWLRGPFVPAGGQAWEAVAGALLGELLACLPSVVHRLDSFLNAANERGNAFYLAHGFRREGLVHVYSVPAAAQRGGRPGAAVPLGPDLLPDLGPSFAALHDATFPTTWITGQGILARLGSDYDALVHARDGQVLGYIVTSLELGSGEGMVEFLGVRPDARRQGIGRGLLQAALGWLFGVKGAPRANLVVGDDKVDARSLYESAGFALRYTGVHNRKDL